MSRKRRFHGKGSFLMTSGRRCYKKGCFLMTCKRRSLRAWLVPSGMQALLLEKGLRSNAAASNVPQGEGRFLIACTLCC